MSSLESVFYLIRRQSDGRYWYYQGGSPYRRGHWSTREHAKPYEKAWAKHVLSQAHNCGHGDAQIVRVTVTRNGLVPR